MHSQTFYFLLKIYGNILTQLRKNMQKSVSLIKDTDKQ